MKKIVSILLASAVSLSAALPVLAEDTFSDVNGNYAWAYDYVEDMASKGLISGYEDGTYRPGKSVSRMEAFALFARLMGSNSEVNEGVLEVAKEKYAAVLADYDLTYAEGDVAFMLMKGVITENELDTYFKGTNKSTPMPRYEAAILITKAMAAEKAATEEVLIDMDYSDVTEIPKDARQYVYYVSETGIMSGMGDGTFSPKTEVNRGQIAVMLSKTFDKINYAFENVKIVSIDTTARNLVIQDADGKKDTIGYNKDTKFTVSGEASDAAAVKAGAQAVLTYCEKDGKMVVAFADVISAVEPDQMLTAIFNGYSSAGGVLNVTVSDPLTLKTKTYNCAPGATISVDGVITTVDKIKNNAYVTMGLFGDEIVSIESMQKSEDITGATISKVDLLGSLTISHENDIYDGLTFPIAAETKIYKNGDIVELGKLYVGDSVTLSLEYGIITKITATSTSTTINGSLKSYTISSTPSLTVKSNGEELTYDIPASVVIVVNGEKGKKLSDIEIGANIKISVESNVVTRVEAIDATGLTANSSVKGVVTAVNTSANVIAVTNTVEGVETITQIICNNNTRFLVLPSLSESALKYIKAGDIVEAYGTYSNGIFVCSGVTYSPSLQ